MATFFRRKEIKTMAENVSSRVTNLDNPLARELLAARHKLRQRALIEEKKPYYRVSKAHRLFNGFVFTKKTDFQNASNRWTLIGAVSMWLGVKIYKAIKGNTPHKSFHD